MKLSTRFFQPLGLFRSERPHTLSAKNSVPAIQPLSIFIEQGKNLLTGYQSVKKALPLLEAIQLMADHHPVRVRLLSTQDETNYTNAINKHLIHQQGFDPEKPFLSKPLFITNMADPKFLDTNLAIISKQAALGANDPLVVIISNQLQTTLAAADQNMGAIYVTGNYDAASRDLLSYARTNKIYVPDQNVSP